MAKPVEFVGFESRPDLKTHLERLLPDLWREVGRWANRVEAVFRLKEPDSERPMVELSLSLRLPHVEGQDTDRAPVWEVEQPAIFRRWVRLVWENVLDNVLNKRADQWEKELNEAHGG